MTVGLVIVSHSVKIAEGVVDLAGQMAGTVAIVAAGGTDDGRIGTSFEKVMAAIAGAESGAGVVVLTDLGSAVLTAETALDFLDDVVKARTVIVDAPLVEGAVAAAVAAETGGDRAAVISAAESARGEPALTVSPVAARRDGVNVESSDGGGNPPGAETTTSRGGASGAGTVIGRAILVNTDGLHARPASEFVKLASGFEAVVSVNGVDAKSLLRIMSLGLAVGSTATIEASGPQAQMAVDALVELIESAFGE